MDDGLLLSEPLHLVRKCPSGSLELVRRGRGSGTPGGGGEGTGWAGLRYQGRLLGLAPAENEIRFPGKSSSI